MHSRVHRGRGHTGRRRIGQPLPNVCSTQLASLSVSIQSLSSNHSSGHQHCNYIQPELSPGTLIFFHLRRSAQAPSGGRWHNADSSYKWRHARQERAGIFAWLTLMLSEEWSQLRDRTVRLRGKRSRRTRSSTTNPATNHAPLKAGSKQGSAARFSDADLTRGRAHTAACGRAGSRSLFQSQGEQRLRSRRASPVRAQRRASWERMTWSKPRSRGCRPRKLR